MCHMNVPIQTSEPSVEKRGGLPLLVLGFRPFFPAAGIFAVLLMVLLIAAAGWMEHRGSWLRYLYGL